MPEKLKTILLTIFVLFLAITGGLIICREAAHLIMNLAALVIDSIWPIARALIGLAGLGAAGFFADRYDLCNFEWAKPKGRIE